MLQILSTPPFKCILYLFLVFHIYPGCLQNISLSHPVTDLASYMFSLPSSTFAYPVLSTEELEWTQIHILDPIKPLIRLLDNQKKSKPLIMDSMILSWNVMEYKSTLKKKKQLIDVQTWMNFKGTKLSNSSCF